MKKAYISIAIGALLLAVIGWQFHVYSHGEWLRAIYICVLDFLAWMFLLAGIVEWRKQRAVKRATAAFTGFSDALGELLLALQEAMPDDMEIDRDLDDGGDDEGMQTYETG